MSCSKIGCRKPVYREIRINLDEATIFACHDHYQMVIDAIKKERAKRLRLDKRNDLHVVVKRPSSIYP